MTAAELIEGLNAHAPHFIKMLGGAVKSVDLEKRSCTFEFNVGAEFCHSVDVVQGGFITAMLDAAMSHAVFAIDRDLVNVSSLEIKTSYLEPTRAGRLTVVGTVIKKAYKTAFLEGHLYDESGLLTATTSSVAKLVRPK